MKVLELSADVLQKIPAEVDYEETRKLLQDDPSPLNVVLLQEIQRYNILLHTIRSVFIWKTESQAETDSCESCELFKSDAY